MVASEMKKKEKNIIQYHTYIHIIDTVIMYIFLTNENQIILILLIFMYMYSIYVTLQ